MNLRHFIAVVSVMTFVILTFEQASAARGGNGKKPNSGLTCKISPDTNVAVYVGGGIGSNSRLWTEALLHFWQTGQRAPGEEIALNANGALNWSGDERINYVTLTLAEFEACSAADLQTLDFFIMPGGSAYEIQYNLRQNGKASLTAYLDGGGNYLGICAGGYYAMKGYYWKGDDGSPTDNCRNQFCRYETNGTFSFDSSTADFTQHEWGGTSYHADLLAYGPLAEVLVEGPIEEIAGPWHADSNPNHPYDSHVLTTNDEQAPTLRAIYWGGATENYLYTSNPTWGENHAVYGSDAAGNLDLDFPQDGSLWALKSVESGSGGKLVLTSAHLEASLHYNAAPFNDGGMTECQQYNNYAYLINVVQREFGLGFGTPDYDLTCSDGRLGEVKNTAELFPAGLAFHNAPRIGEGGGGGGGGGGESGSVNFESGNIEPFSLTGSAVRPWRIDSSAACTGSYGVKAGDPGGVDGETTLTLSVPADTTQIEYRYSYPAALDRGDDFHVRINDSVVRSYETGPGEVCATDRLLVTPGDQLSFYCKSGGRRETCAVDDVVFIP